MPRDGHGRIIDYMRISVMDRCNLRCSYCMPLEGLKFLLLEATDSSGASKGTQLVAADAVGAGQGDLVLYASGSSARLTQVTENRPVDAVVMAIVDLVDRSGEVTYHKGDESRS